MHRDNQPKGRPPRKHGMITDAFVTPGNVHDSLPFPGRLMCQMERFGQEAVAAGMEAGYFTAAVCHLTQEPGVRWCGVTEGRSAGRMSTRKSTLRITRRVMFTRVRRENCRATAPRAATATVITVRMRRYACFARSVRSVRQNKNGQKTVTRHVWEKAPGTANALRLTKWGKKVYARRKETVERSLADAKQHHGHRHARFRGVMKVQMQSLLAATAQTMKKMALPALLRGLIKAIKSLITLRGEENEGPEVIMGRQIKISRSCPADATKKNPT